MEFEDLQQVMADVFEVEPYVVTPTSTPDDIPTWDSLRLLDLVMAIEQQFGVQIDPERMHEMMSVPAVLAIVRDAQRA